MAFTESQQVILYCSVIADFNIFVCNRSKASRGPESSKTSKTPNKKGVASTTNSQPPLPPRSNPTSDVQTARMSDLELDMDAINGGDEVTGISFTSKKGPPSPQKSPTKMGSSLLSRSISAMGENEYKRINLTTRDTGDNDQKGSTINALFNDADEMVKSKPGDTVDILRSSEYKGDIGRLLSEEEEEEEFEDESRDVVHDPDDDGVSPHLSRQNARSKTLTKTPRTMAFTSRSMRNSTLSTAEADGLLHSSQEELTDQAVTVVQRVADKLTGLDFQEKRKKTGKALEISEQIDLLIQQATSNENLSTCFIGWCAFW